MLITNLSQVEVPLNLSEIYILNRSLECGLKVEGYFNHKACFTIYSPLWKTTVVWDIGYVNSHWYPYYTCVFYPFLTSQLNYGKKKHFYLLNYDRFIVDPPERKIYSQPLLYYKEQLLDPFTMQIYAGSSNST